MSKLIASAQVADSATNTTIDNISLLEVVNNDTEEAELKKAILDCLPEPQKYTAYFSWIDC